MRSFLMVIAVMESILVIYHVVHCDAVNECVATSSEKKETDYYVVAKSYKSKQNEIARKSTRSVEDCKRLARSVKGMAFSFKSAVELNDKNESNFSTVIKSNDTSSCFVYDCPEVENSTSIVQIRGYDYYSIFGDPIPPMNATCLPQLGVFVTHRVRVNYTTAKQRCEEYGSVLPDVATEKITNSLGDMLEEIFERGTLKEAFVGLENAESIDGSFMRSTGEKLTCSTFRAWAPGHPKRLNESCVLLTSTRMWKTVDCKVRKPFICEIYPGDGNTTDYDSNYDYYDYSLDYLSFPSIV